MNGIKLTGYVPGAIGRVKELHAKYYNEPWGFDLFFEAKVATELSEFLCRFKEGRDGFRVAWMGGEIIGSIAIDGIHVDNKGVYLRWFIVDPKAHGQGIGRTLLDEAVNFYRRVGFGRIYLWTFAGLDPARHLYERAGFRLCEEQEGTQWGKKVVEQMFELSASIRKYGHVFSNCNLKQLLTQH